MYDLDDLLNRVADMAQEALGNVIVDGGTAKEATWKPYWPYFQETLPYGYTRINSMTVDIVLSDDVDLHIYTLGINLVIGHLGSGYEGEQEQKVYSYIEQFVEFFGQHPDLTSTAYTTPPDYLWPQYHGAHLTGIPGGTRTANVSGVPKQQHVVEFELEVPVMWQFDRA